MTRPPRRPRAAVLACVLVTLLPVSLLPGPAVASPGRDRWDADLSLVDGDDVNVRHSRSGLRLADTRPAPRTAGSPHSARAEGMHLSAPRRLHRPATRVRAQVTATVTGGGLVVTQVRGWLPSGWSEWREASPAAIFERPVDIVQTRLVIVAGSSGGVEVRAVRLTADRTATTPVATTPVATAASPGLTFRVYATRIGLVGQVTANGHTVQARDHFVALPSRRSLSPRNSGDYTLRVCTTTGSRCEYAPVWDVGPWNTRDDYWNISGVRENWKNLPQGLPQAQAAYQSGYNDGRDQFGRVVLNPAGVDLADGTFWDGLRLTTNAWVDVAYLWTGSGPRGVVGDGPLNVRTGASTAYPSRGLAARYASVPIQCFVVGQTVAGPYRTTNRWDRLAGGQYVSHAFISSVWGGAVPRC